MSQNTSKFYVALTKLFQLLGTDFMLLSCPNSQNSVKFHGYEDIKDDAKCKNGVVWGS